MLPGQLGRTSVHPHTRALAQYVITIYPEVVLGRKKSKVLGLREVLP